ncbi:MAG: hypothetical protein ABI669_01080, partial [Usitatibacter sp.]
PQCERPVSIAIRHCYDGCMQARVYLLRRNGRRVDPREDRCFNGTLMVDATVQGHAIFSAAHLRQQVVRGSHQEDVVPPLYEPVLAAIGAGVLLLRGYESRDGAGYVQEWRCVLEEKSPA